MIRILSILTIGIYSISQAQNLANYQQVDKLKVKGLTTKVYFNDPLKHLITTYPDFDTKDNQTKHKLLSEFLHNNPLYVFETYRKRKPDKSYWLVGNPRKVRTINYFDLEIRNVDRSIDKVVDEVKVGGSFFEHMMLFQSPRRKQSVGIGLQIWGYFTRIQPYSPIKSAIVSLIEQDIANSIPDEILSKDEEKIEPLFDYQKCGLEKVNKRVLTVNVYQYDSLGNVTRQYPRSEEDNQLYYSSISKDLTGVVTFPYFSSEDEKIISDSIITVNSELENINHYLKEVKIVNNQNDEIERIEGKLIIHGYSIEGHYTHDELYLLEFSDLGMCRLPTLVKLCPLDDVKYERPRLTIDIKYELK